MRQPLPDELAELEKRRIEEALNETEGNQTKAAELLGISRRTLIHKMEKHGLKETASRPAKDGVD